MASDFSIVPSRDIATIERTDKIVKQLDKVIRELEPGCLGGSCQIMRRGGIIRPSGYAMGGMIGMRKPVFKVGIVRPIWRTKTII
jgi:hypothetical protein